MLSSVSSTGAGDRTGDAAGSIRLRSSAISVLLEKRKTQTLFQKPYKEGSIIPYFSWIICKEKAANPNPRFSETESWEEEKESDMDSLQRRRRYQKGKEEEAAFGRRLVGKR
ncbi:hypothetical protein AAC387_Pa02g3505 [Persea americana]